jgi:hypothetical protein
VVAGAMFSLTLGWVAVSRYRLLHYFQNLDRLRCRRDLVFVVVQDVEASLPVSLEAGIADGDGNVRALAGGEQYGRCGETDYDLVSNGVKTTLTTKGLQ